MSGRQRWEMRNPQGWPPMTGRGIRTELAPRAVLLHQRLSPQAILQFNWLITSGARIERRGRHEEEHMGREGTPSRWSGEQTEASGVAHARQHTKSLRHPSNAREFSAWFVHFAVARGTATP